MEKVPISTVNSHNNKIFVRNKHLIRQRTEIYIQQFRVHEQLEPILRHFSDGHWTDLKIRRLMCHSAVGHWSLDTNQKQTYPISMVCALSVYMRIGQILSTVECRHWRYWWPAHRFWVYFIRLAIALSGRCACVCRAEDVCISAQRVITILLMSCTLNGRNSLS